MTIRRIPRVYCAGPYSGPSYEQRRDNTQRAADVGARVAALGAYPVVPHLVGHHVAELCHVEHAYEWWIEVTADELRTCDAVFLVPGWEQSRGASGEQTLALELGLPVFTTMPALRDWLRGKGVLAHG